MDDLSERQTAVELLQQLGLKEYEARAFVALTRAPRATAKQISEMSEVPRTRVYDAVRVLESKGLVEIQHSNPQQFRAVSIEEAASTLSQEYQSRTDELQSLLTSLPPVETDHEDRVAHEVWSLTGAGAIEQRTISLVDEAESEAVIVIGRSSTFTDQLRDRLAAAERRGVTVYVGTLTAGLQETVERALPQVTTFVSGLDWLGDTPPTSDETLITRLLLVDRETILISTAVRESPVADAHESAVFGRGFHNGLVALTRRMMATGLLPNQ